VANFFFTEGGARGIERLRDFLSTEPPELRRALERILPQPLHDRLGLRGWSWTAELVGEATGSLAKADAVVRSDVNKLNRERNRRFRENKSVDYIQRVIRTIKSENLLSFLARHNVLPKYGFPVDVVELSSQAEQARSLDLSRDLRIAIAEYAPGGSVVAGGYLWTSRALKRVPKLEWPRYRFAICDACRRYFAVRLETEKLPENCSCGAPLARAKRRGKFVTPIFGFETDASEGPRKPPESRPLRVFASRVHFASVGEEVDSLPSLADGLLSARCARNAKLAVLTRSPFWVCEKCGFASKESGRPSEHKPPWTREKQQTCRHTLTSWYLGHEFSSDLVELRINRQEQDELALSLLYAILEGASSALEIPRRDLDGCLYFDQSLPTLVIYDNVPGGAGHSRAIFESIQMVLEAARDRVDGRCGCGGGPDGEGETSCYGCLRSYSNQHYHRLLKRRLAFDFLSQCLPGL